MKTNEYIFLQFVIANISKYGKDLILSVMTRSDLQEKN